MHICPNNKKYIGITCQEPEKRWINGKGYKTNDYFFRAIKKYSWRNIQHKILYEHLTKEEAEQKEIELIAFYKSNQREYGYNVESGGNCTGMLSNKQKEKISKSFYSDIGVRSDFEKRNNTVMAEVEADTSLLLLNLSDMIDCRKKAANEVNKMFGTNWSVHIAKEIDYSVENERYKFDTDTETHIVEEKNNENYNS